MARKSYYKPYRRSYRSKTHWASNMKNGSLYATTTSGSGHAEDVLVVNSTQSSSPTPTIIKTGNFKIQGDAFIYAQQSGTLAGTTSVVVYVMYLPEVVVASANPITAINDHPEWIMGWKLVDFGLSNNTGASSAYSFSFSTRLKRNLNSGDSIALVAVLRDAGSSTVSFRVNYCAQYFTRAN